jgi:RNA polymerase sigma-70 factor (ECF subfamily)
MEDTEIVTMYFERRETAIQETENKYGVYLKAVAYHILRSFDDTEEVLDDTYMAAWNAIPPTKPENLKHFLSRITRNLSFDRLDYKNAGKRQALFVELDECIPDRQNDMETIWEAKEIGRVINNFLQTLDSKTCAVFLARYYYAYSVRELAEQYGISERRVKYLLEKTRKSLCRIFEKEGVTL